MGRYTSLALVNVDPDGELSLELEELISAASDVIVVIDLDEQADGEALVTSAIDGEYGEALPDGLAGRLNAWAKHSQHAGMPAMPANEEDDIRPIHDR